MKNDTLIRKEGMEALMKKLGLVEAERFVMLIQDEPFDYTKWQENLFEDKSIETIFAEAAALRARTEKQEKAKAPSRKVKATPRTTAAPRQVVAARTPTRRRKTTKRLVHA